MLLSILIPSVPSRSKKFQELIESLERQVSQCELCVVEVLGLVDLKSMTLGEKRNRLMRIASGKFMIHLDDDDRLVPEALPYLLPILEKNPEADVIAYDGLAYLNGKPPFVVRTSIEFDNEQVVVKDGVFQDVKRKPWHWCCWRTDLGRQFEFKGYIDEDWYWLRQVIPHVKNQVKLDRVLHVYDHNDDDSLCGVGEMACS